MYFLKTKYIHKFLIKHDITDDALEPALNNLLAEKYDADLGAKLFKVRIKREGQGKSGGFRSLWFMKKNDIIILLHFFSKNKTDNISPKELKALKLLAKQYDKLTEEQIQILIATKEMLRIKYGNQDQN